MSRIVIDCGIGEITYTSPDNLLLKQLMENLEELIKQSSPLAVNNLLQDQLKETA